METKILIRPLLCKFSFEKEHFKDGYQLGLVLLICSSAKFSLNWGEKGINPAEQGEARAPVVTFLI